MSNYCVYCHTFPNGKKYIGISKDAEKRWNNGHGYDSQPKIRNAIQKYGWANVNHEILAERLTKEIAVQLEKHYISEYDSIRKGYNVSIGGDDFNATYLDAYVLEMVRGLKAFFNSDSIVDLVYSDRVDKEAAGFWNEASNAVVRKHKRYSATDEWEIAQYWYYMGQYVQLWCAMENDKDVTGWVEKPIEQAVAEYYKL